jgi:hypothetical protein
VCSISWCNVRLDAGASAYSTMLAAYLIYGPTVRDASTIGFILSVVRADRCSPASLLQP